jgi:hypothetical protein
MAATAKRNPEIKIRVKIQPLTWLVYNHNKLVNVYMYSGRRLMGSLWDRDKVILITD